MQIHTTCRHGKLSPAVRRFLEERLAKLERFAFVSEAHVILDHEKYRHTAEVLLKTRKKELIAREEAADQTSAIDAAVDRLERQLKRLKEKRSTRILHDGTRTNGDEKKGAVRGAARVALAGAAAEPTDSEEFEEFDEFDGGVEAGAVSSPAPGPSPARAPKRKPKAKAKASSKRAVARRR